MKENLKDKIVGILEGHTNNPSKTPIVNFSESYMELDKDFHKKLKECTIMRLFLADNNLDTLNALELFAIGVLLSTF